MAGVKQFDERAVLEKAMEAFRRKGFAETSMVDLARTTKVQRGSLYNAFADKEAIFLKAYDLYAERFLGAMREALADPDPRGAVRAVLDAGIANMCGGRPAHGCLTTRTVMDAAAQSAAVRARVRRLLDQFETMIADMLAAAAARGAFAGDARASARVVVALTRGLAVLERAYGDEERLRETAEAAIAMMFAKPAP